MQTIHTLIRGEREGRVRGSCGSGWWVCVGCGVFVLVDGLLGLPCDEDGEKGRSDYWRRLGDGMAHEMSINCAALLIDVHNNIE